MTTTEGKTTAQAIRQQRLKSLIRSLSLWVVLPTLLASIYYGAVASSEYQSVGVLALHSGLASADESSSGGKRAKDAEGSADGRIGLLLQDYARSRDMLELLMQQHAFAKHYQADEVDWLSRTPADASRESLYALFREHVSITFSEPTKSLRIRVFAFSPKSAQTFVTAISGALKLRLRSMHDHDQSERISVAERDMADATKRYSAARAAYIKSQPSAAPPEPKAADGDAPPAGESAKAPLEPTSVSELEFRRAEKLYQATAASLRRVRLAGAEGQRYFSMLVKPSLPDAAARPKRMWSIATVFVCALLLMGVLGLLTAAVREHANF